MFMNDANSFLIDTEERHIQPKDCYLHFNSDMSGDIPMRITSDLHSSKHIIA